MGFYSIIMMSENRYSHNKGLFTLQPNLGTAWINMVRVPRKSSARINF